MPPAGLFHGRLAATDGVIQHSVTTDRAEMLPTVRAELEAYVESRLLTEPGRVDE